MDAISLLLGILAGGVLASLIWIIAKIISGNKEKAVVNERNSCLNSIGELIAEADSLLLSFSTGSATKERMKSEVTRLMEAIRKLYKPNIHLFEVFYIKYIETLLIHYASYLKESSPVQVIMDEPVHHAPRTVPIEKPEIAIASVAAPAVAAATEKVETVLNVKTQSAASVQPAPAVADDDEEISEILLAPDTVSPESCITGSDDEFSIEPVSTAHLEILPVEDADIPDFTTESEELASDAVDLQQREESIEIASASIPHEQESEISFEEMAQDVLTIEDDNDAGFSSIANKSLDAQVKQIESVGNGKSDEDFSMETIMDLDMSKIPGFNSEKSKFTFKSKTEKPVESKLDEAEISFEPAKTQFASQETKKILSQSVPAASPGLNGEIKTPASFGKQKAELSAKFSQPEIKPEIIQKTPIITDRIIPADNQNHADKDHYTITGDDVADQIDSFFGFDKQ